MNNLNECGCGRSPTGKCVGWHDLSEDEYKEKLAAYQAKKSSKKWFFPDFMTTKAFELSIHNVFEKKKKGVTL